MNINDFNVPIPEGDMLETIFKHQWALMVTYHEVESLNLCVSIPDPRKIDLDDKFCQLRLKEFAWRITEELAEATEAHEDELHFLEELIDALHFSVELNLMVKIKPIDLVSHIFEDAPMRDKLEMLHCHGTHSTFSPSFVAGPGAVWSVVEALGCAMNCLKNKPWKTTHMVTDKLKFHQAMLLFNRRFFDLLWLFGFTPKTLTQVYLNKNAVNQFRIRSNY